MKSHNRFENASLCTHCGYCLSSCPTYRLDNQEAQSPRGRVSIVLALRQGTLTSQEAIGALSHCLVCRACHQACPAGVRPGKLVLTARSMGKTPKPLFSSLFHFLTHHHGLTSLAGRIIHAYQKSTWRPWIRQKSWFQAFTPLKRLEMFIPEYHAPSTLSGKISPPTLRIALLCGCMARLFHASLPSTMTSLLASLQIEVRVLDGFGCCGAPYRESGERKAFLRQARKVLDAFRPVAREVDAVVCDTAVCAMTVKSYARALSKDPDYAEDAKRFSAIIQDFSSLILDRIPFMVPNRKPLLQTPTVFLDHCQTRHGSGMIQEPRSVLRTVTDHILELPDAGSCCGTAGDYTLRHPEKSSQIRQKKVLDIIQSGAECVVGVNSGCLITLEAQLKASGSTIPVRHLAEVLWETYANENDLHTLIRDVLN